MAPVEGETTRAASQRGGRSRSGRLALVGATVIVAAITVPLAHTARSAAPEARAGVPAARAVHTRSAVAAAHRRLIAAARSGALLRRYGVVEWGPSEKGYEEVATTDPARVRALSDFLATNLAGGDHTLYVVIARPGLRPIPVWG